MMSYVFSNKSKSIDDIIQKLTKLFDLEIIKDTPDVTMGNSDIYITVDKKRTCIFLMNHNINIMDITNYYME